MGSSVEISVKYSGEGPGLAHRIAQDLGVVSYFYSGLGYVLMLDAQRFIGTAGSAHLDLALTDLGASGEPGPAEDTALAPYEYELGLSFRVAPPADPDEVLERLGRAIFDELTGLGLPLAYGGGGLVFADFLPGRGVREFPPLTDIEEKGRVWWFEPRLHREPATPWPGEVAALSVPPSHRVTVFETAKLLQFVSVSHVDGHWVSPAASALSTVRPREIGLILAHAQRTKALTAHDEREQILTSMAGLAQLSIEDFGRRSVSLEIHADTEGLVAVPHGPRPDPSDGLRVSGPAMDALACRLPASASPEDAGQLLVSLVATVRSHVAGTTASWQMNPDQVVAALERQVLEPGTAIEERRDWPDVLVFYAGRFRYEARPAAWRIASEPWVGATVRVVADGHANGFIIEYGLVFTRGGQVLYLNDQLTMRKLGRRMGDDLDPLAYAELLGEMYSGPKIDEATVTPFSATELHRPGGLISDVAAFVVEYPFVNAALLFPPKVRLTDGEAAVEFCSYHYYLTETSVAVDILEWTVVSRSGREVTWSRRYVAERLEPTY